MKVQSISPSYFSKAYLKSFANSKTNYAQANSYSTNSIKDTSFGSYYYNPTDVNCRKILDSYEDRFSENEKLEILYFLRKMDTKENKSKTLRKILECKNPAEEYLDSEDVIYAIRVISGKSPEVQRGLANMMYWRTDAGFGLTTVDLFRDIKYLHNRDGALFAIGGLENSLKKAKMSEAKRGQIIGDTIAFITKADDNYLPVIQKLAKVLANPELKKELLKQWDFILSCEELNSYLDSILSKN